MKIVLKNRRSGVVLWEGEAESKKAAVGAAIRAGSDLIGCDLSGCDLSRCDLSYCDLSDSDLSDCNLRYSNVRFSNLSGSNLSRCNLSGSNLSRCNLSRSNLSGSDLRGSDLHDCDLSYSDLRGSNLSRSDLSRSDLRGSNLSGCNLSYSNLRGSNLSYSDLRGSDLSNSDLTPIRDDFWAVLSAQPREVDGLRAAIAAGKIDGSTYQGNCACLVGTLAKVGGVDIESLACVKPDASRPIERFFLGIKPHDTPANNPVSKICLEWIDQWLAAMRSAFGVGAGAADNGAF